LFKIIEQARSPDAPPSTVDAAWHP
jgi:hypothetical protein